MRQLEERVAEVERVNARLEEAALTTARALGEVSRHWDAVYDAMRRADRIEDEISSERDHAASRARRGESSDQSRCARRHRAVEVVATPPVHAGFGRGWYPGSETVPSFRRCAHSEQRQV